MNYIYGLNKSGISIAKLLIKNKLNLNIQKHYNLNLALFSLFLENIYKATYVNVEHQEVVDLI